MSPDETLLGPYRVLDLCDVRGALCGSILADMGADVIQVEPPEGCSTRRMAPFLNDEPHPERSLVWWALSKNKRSLAIDLRAAQGREAFWKLVDTADFLIESFQPGYMDELGLGYEEVLKRKPSMVYVSITPYGQTGPHSRWQAADLNVQGMGGHMYLSGDVERAPVRVGLPASYWHAGGEGAASALTAHRHRRRTGRGQHVDVSMQQCIIWTLLNTTMTWQMVRRQEMRGGAVRRERGNTVYTRAVWNCLDGFVQFIPIGGGGGKARVGAYQRFVDWMTEEGHYDPSLTAKDWNFKDIYNFTPEEYEVVASHIGRFLMTKTVSELYEQAVKRRLLIAPILNVKDLLDSPQLQERQFLLPVEHPELDRSFVYPGAFAHFSRTPIGQPRRAPLLGEHNGEILAELGVTELA